MKLPLLFASIAAATLVLVGAGDANAQKKDDKKGQVFELGTVVITARPTRPSAVVELGKLFPEVELAKLHQNFMSKIEEAIMGDPF